MKNLMREMLISACAQAYAGDLPIGVIVCKQEQHRDKLNRGYLAMLSTHPSYRGKGIGLSLLAGFLFRRLTKSTVPQQHISLDCL